jgi:hypothetical protein
VLTGLFVDSRSRIHKKPNFIWHRYFNLSWEWFAIINVLIYQINAPKNNINVSKYKTDHNLLEY